MAIGPLRTANDSDLRTVDQLKTTMAVGMCAQSYDDNMEETAEEQQRHVEVFQRIAADDGQMRTKVVGDSHLNDDGSSRQQIIANCKAGDVLRLKREPHNRYDPNAVAVLTRSGKQIGYLSRDRALFLKPYLAQGSGELQASIAEITGGTEGKPDRGVNIIAHLIAIDKGRKSNASYGWLVPLALVAAIVVTWFVLG